MRNLLDRSRFCALPVLALCGAAACSDADIEHWQAPSITAPGPSLTFVSPSPGQEDVPSTARIYVRLTQPLAPGHADEGLRIVDSDGKEVPLNQETFDDGRTYVLAPLRPLTAGAAYRLVFRATDDTLAPEFEASRFRVAPSGTRSTDGLFVASVQPLDAPDATVWPFTTLYVLLSEAVQPETVTGGTRELASSSVRVLDVDTGVPVEGTLLARGSRIAFDPEKDLVPGKRYRLELTESLRDLAGEALTPTSREFTVTAAPLTRTVTLAIGEAARPAGTQSTLDGREVNTLELRSRLVGTSQLRAVGSLRAELPDLAQFDARVPLVVRKGQVLTFTTPDPRGLAIQLHGQVPTSLYSGPLQLTVLTDSVGEMAENTFAQSTPTAPPQVKMRLDASLSAGNPAVHALLNQDLLHLQLHGLTRVEDGRLHVEFVGGVELDLLGMETAPSVVSLAAASVDAAPPVSLPTFRVLSAPPNGTLEALRIEPSFRVLLSRPADERTVPTGLWLERGAGDARRGTADDVPGVARQDGSTLFFTPDARLASGGRYTLRVGTSLRSVSGEGLEAEETRTFTTASTSTSNPRPPLVASIYPGQPCALVPSLEGGVACTPSARPEPPRMLPAQLPFQLTFLGPIAAETLTLGGSVRIESADGKPVPGRLEASELGARFLPDGGWSSGERYQVRINAREDAPCGPQRICDADGRPLNTDVLLAKDVVIDGNGELVHEAPGGPPIEVSFTALPANHENLVALQLGPIADTNANGRLDEGEQAHDVNFVRMHRPNGSVVTSHLSGNLLASMGDYDVEQRGVRVTVSPGSWMFATSTLGDLTDRLIIRPTREAHGVLRGAPAGDPDARPVVSMVMEASAHSVDNKITDTLQQAPLVLELTGRATFQEDGTLLMTLTNTNDTQLQVLDGDVTLRILAGDVQVRAATPPLKAPPSRDLAPVLRPEPR